MAFSQEHPIIIIGAGLAAYQVAREFRKINSHTPLIMITADDGRFYPKPQLSTAKTQKKSLETLVTATAETMSAQLNMEIRTLTRVTAIDADAHLISTETEKFHYQKLILACGADVIKPPLTGDAVNEVLSINHLYHFADFERKIENKKHLTILGAGLIGCEFANDLSNAGYEVHVIAPDKFPLSLFVPEEVGNLLKKELEKNGVHFHLQCVANTVNKINEKYCLDLSNGKKLETEFILSAIGLRPHTALAVATNIKINRGILVNRFLETSAADVYALGDCAEVEGHVLPFITPMLNCARALAKTLHGEQTAVEYPAMPVVVKTPAHPIVVCPPPKKISGEWEVSSDGNSMRAYFFDAEKKLFGFVLTNEAVKERAELLKKIPPLI